MRAMVLAAGVGSRLEPLSNYIPKPLIRIGGRPVMEHILLLLRKHGFTEVISNTCHLAASIEDYFATKDFSISFVREAKLSGVAGGIRACANFLKDSTACIIMGDALTDIDLGTLYQEHLKAVSQGCIVTVAKMQVEDTRHFGVIVTDASNRIINFQEKPKPEDALSNWANTGIYFFEPEVYKHIPLDVPVYDVAKNLFPDLLAKGKYMQAIAVEPNAYWADIGTPEQYLQSLRDINSALVKLDLLPNISATARIDKSAQLSGAIEIADGALIEADVELHDCIIWEQAHIARGARLSNCIVGPHTSVETGSSVSNKVIANVIASETTKQSTK